MKSGFQGYVSLDAARKFFFFFEILGKEKLVEAQMKFLVQRTWISRSSALVFLWTQTFLGEEIAEVQVKSGFQGHGSLEAAPLFFFLRNA